MQIDSEQAEPVDEHNSEHKPEHKPEHEPELDLELDLELEPEPEPGGAGTPDPPARGGPPHPAAGRARGYDIDEAPDPPQPRKLREPQEPSPRKADDVCPNCGQARPDRNEMVCMECGYNMRTLRVERTRAGKPEEVEPDAEPVDQEEEEAERPVLSRPGRGNLTLPAAGAAIAGAILLFGALFGVEGLFPGHPRVSDGAIDPINFGERMAGIGKLLVLACVWFGCGTGALVVLAGLNNARLGDVRLIAVRMACVVLVMRLWAVLDVGWLVETPPQIATYAALALWLFDLKPRDAVLHGLLTLGCFVVLWSLSNGVTWAMGAGA